MLGSCKAQPRRDYPRIKSSPKQGLDGTGVHSKGSERMGGEQMDLTGGCGGRGKVRVEISQHRSRLMVGAP